MDRYYIALTELGLSNEIVLNLIKDYDKTILSSFFEGNIDVLSSNLQFLPVRDLLNDKIKQAESLEKADKILMMNQENDIHTAIYSQDGYPTSLMQLSNPPAIIYYKGTRPDLICQKAVACVGTRNPTLFGFNAVHFLVPQLVNEGFSIVSGLANGIDRLSHISCMTNGGKTIAVLAHGLDMVYPAANKQLANDIPTAGGTLMSEYQVGTPPVKYRFVNRNRLIVGLSQATVAMEFALNSGTMHTIDFALEQKCPVFCPNPGDNIKPSISGLSPLIETKKCDVIDKGMDFEKVILAAGFKPEKQPLSPHYVMEQYLRALIFGISKSMLRKTLKDIGMKKIPTNSNLDELFHHVLEYIEEASLPLGTVIGVFISNMVLPSK